jgi:hypothetical protein
LGDFWQAPRGRPANGTKLIPAALTQKAIFWRGKNILKTKIFCDVTTLLNERKHLKILIKSVPDPFSPFRLNRSTWPDYFTPCTLTFVKVAQNLFQMLVTPTGACRAESRRGTRLDWQGRNVPTPDSTANSAVWSGGNVGVGKLIGKIGRSIEIIGRYKLR